MPLTTLLLRADLLVRGWTEHTAVMMTDCRAASIRVLKCRAFWIPVSLFVISVGIVWGLEYLTHSSQELHNWYQTLAGDWSFSFYEHQPFLFSFMAVFAFTLNWSAIFLIFSVVRPLLTKERTMRLTTLLLARDREIKTQIFNSLPSEMKTGEAQKRTTQKIDEAFSAGNKKFETEDLPDILGRKEAKRMIRQFQRELEVSKLG